MKLISRKSLVAVACSAAMITGATVAPAMAAEKPATISSQLGNLGKKDDATTTTTATTGTSESKAAEPAGSVESPKELGEWAKAVAAIISTLTAIWTFVQKFLLKK